jgi:hypothetical protein
VATADALSAYAAGRAATTASFIAMVAKANAGTFPADSKNAGAAADL